MLCSTNCLFLVLLLFENKDVIGTPDIILTSGPVNSVDSPVYSTCEIGPIFFWHKTYTIIDNQLYCSFGELPKHALFIITRIILVYYCKCYNLIGYSTHYLFIVR